MDRRMDRRTDGQTNGWTDGLTDGRTDERTDKRADRWTDGRTAQGRVGRITSGSEISNDKRIILKAMCGAPRWGRRSGMQKMSSWRCVVYVTPQAASGPLAARSALFDPSTDHCSATFRRAHLYLAAPIGVGPCQPPFRHSRTGRRPREGRGGRRAIRDGGGGGGGEGGGGAVGWGRWEGQAVGEVSTDRFRTARFLPAAIR